MYRVTVKSADHKTRKAAIARPRPTQAAIFDEVAGTIPAMLWVKYKHLSFGEMAEIPELEEWAGALRHAEREWFRATQ